MKSQRPNRATRASPARCRSRDSREGAAPSPVGRHPLAAPRRKMSGRTLLAAQPTRPWALWSRTTSSAAGVGPRRRCRAPMMRTMTFPGAARETSHQARSPRGVQMLGGAASRPDRARGVPDGCVLPPLDAATLTPEAFVRANTRLASPPQVPEIRLHIADEALELWSKTEELLGRRDLPPPFWAFAWAGG